MVSSLQYDILSLTACQMDYVQLEDIVLLSVYLHVLGCVNDLHQHCMALPTLSPRSSQG